MMNFYKFQGTGNDFILIDGRNSAYNFSKEEIAHLCDRRFGIGADGFIIVENGNLEYDFKMSYFNADGNIASLCGNGSRCTVAFAHYLEMIGQECRFLAFDGVHRASILQQHENQWEVAVQMCEVSDIQHYEDGYFLDTGSPHFVVFGHDLEHFDVFNEGCKLRYDARFPNGSNIDFVEYKDHKLFVRTFERGVEDETLSCGTGVTAAALAFAHHNQLPDGKQHIDIHTLGGDLVVDFQTSDHSFTDILLQGSAVMVYQGIFFNCL